MVLCSLPSTWLVSGRRKKQMFPAAHPLPLEGFQGWERALGKRELELRAACRAPGAD